VRTVVIMGAGGRDFHNFNTVFRNDADTRVVAFTATQIPGIAGRTYPPALAGSSYPNGIPIRPEEELASIIRDHHVDEVVLAYSDLSHEEVMHKASAVLAGGADFRLLGATMLRSARPVVAISAVRTGAGKSQTSRRVGRLLLDAGLRVALVRHPMPYGDLERMRVQRFATLADIDASSPTIEEREEYEEPVRQGMVMYAGVDDRGILYRAENDADVIVWDGGNNDFPFFAPDLHIAVADPLRPGHELRYHPGETNLRMADVVVINKVDSAEPAAVAAVAANVAATNPRATVIRAASPVTLEPGPTLAGARVLVIEDGPRPYAVGSIAETFRAYPSIGLVLPAMGYGKHQIEELRATIAAADCDVVVAGTPIGLRRVVGTARQVRQARYELRELGHPDPADVLAPILAAARPARPVATAR
jgi:predicted GTPase